MISLILALVLLFVVALLAILFNRFVTLKNMMQEGLSGIDVQLKRRYDLIPNLIETVKGYMQHERGVLEKVTQLRSSLMSSANVESKAGLENSLSECLKTIFAVAENYPELKANQGFLDLQKNLTEIEEQIQLSRRYYNGTVRNYNILVESFPSNLIAQVFNFKKAEFFEVESALERQAPAVKF